MIKMTAKALAIIFAGSLLVSTNASAISMTEDYWTLADLTTYTTGSNISTVNFGLMFQTAVFFNSGGSFGFYDMNDASNTLEVLSLSTGTQNSVYFTENSNVWSAGLQSDLSDQSVFNKIFGFYFTFGGVTYYTDASLNGGVDYISINYTPYSGIIDFSLNGSVMASVNTNDISPAAPVPEPSTLLLLGTGLVGIAGCYRRTRTKA